MNLPLPTPEMFIAGYIDPSAGHMFSSMGPAILTAIGGAVGFITIFFKKIITFIKSLLTKGKSRETSKHSHPGN